MPTTSAADSLSFDAIMFDDVKTLADLFEFKLQSLYDAEQQLLKVLPKLAIAATDPQLRISLEKHLGEIEGQITRLAQVAANLGLPVAGPSCKAMHGLLEEADQLLALNTSDEVMDAAIISTAQAAGHYKIAQYDTLARFAERLGYPSEAQLVGSSLAEVKNTQVILNQLATSASIEKAFG